MNIQLNGYYIEIVDYDGLERYTENGEIEYCDGVAVEVYNSEDAIDESNMVDAYFLAVGYEIKDKSPEEIRRVVTEETKRYKKQEGKIMFTEHEKQLIAGAILAQMKNLPDAIKKVVHTGDTALVDALRRHTTELHNLYSKVCSMMKDELNEDDDEDDIYEICYQDSVGNVGTLDILHNEEIASCNAEDFRLYYRDQDHEDGDKIIVKRYSFVGNITEMEII